MTLITLNKVFVIFGPLTTLSSSAIYAVPTRDCTFQFQATSSADPTNVIVDLEFSVDGVNFKTEGSIDESVFDGGLSGQVAIGSNSWKFVRVTLRQNTNTRSVSVTLVAKAVK